MAQRSVKPTQADRERAKWLLENNVSCSITRYTLDRIAHNPKHRTQGYILDKIMHAYERAKWGASGDQVAAQAPAQAPQQDVSPVAFKQAISDCKVMLWAINQCESVERAERAFEGAMDMLRGL